MCGIAGWFGNYTLATDEALTLLRHRGPDQEGSYLEDGLQLVHTRLSIQDLSAQGRQPMQSADGRFVLVYNGELYNHQTLRQELQQQGQIFQSTSDTETLLYALATWGVYCLPRLNGIFAFALYDREEKSLLLVRDHIGVKPLYYAISTSGIIFASELKVVIKGLVEPKPDAKALMNYLCLLWSPGDVSPEESVLKLLPGHYLKVDLSSATPRPSLKRYYSIPFNGVYPIIDEKTAVKELESVLLGAVERQLLSDVPVGFFLSGGLDSSLLVAMARTITGKRQQCFTIDTGFANVNSEGFTNDLHYATKVAQILDVDLDIVKADIDIVRDFDHMIWHLDEPQADPAPLNVLNISRRAKAMGYKVLIGGTAGDDLFTGYRRHQAIWLEKYINLLPQNLAITLAKLPLSAGSPIQRRLRKVLLQFGLPTANRLASYFEWLPSNKVSALFTPKWKAELIEYRPTDYLLEALNAIPEERSWVNRMLYWECISFLPDHNLNYTDKMGMAEGVEIRVPYLDLELVDLSTKIHPNLKLKGRETKYILKKVAEKYLPHEVIYRPKTGFGAPVRHWVSGAMRPLIEERLSPDRLRQQGIFNPDVVWQLIKDNETGKVDAAYTIWALLAIESWYRQFIGED